jgi:hypothetical protein
VEGQNAKVVRDGRLRNVARYGDVILFQIELRGEYDDGAAMIDGDLQDIHGRADLRVRHLTPYKLLIAANGSPINNPAFDKTSADQLDGTLNTGEGLDDLAAKIWKLRRPRQHEQD